MLILPACIALDENPQHGIAEALKTDFVRRASVDLHSLLAASASAIERAAMVPPRSVKCILL